MKVLDLFSGIGGFSLGLERAGMETVAFCEIEPFCQKVLAKHWPGVPIYDDVREITAERLRADGIFPEVITGGFPCQDISLAGKQAGIEGERSGLWGELCRIIGDVQPRYAIVENVTALISGDSGRWFGRVLGDLAEIGYDAEWHCIPASSIGANHRRDRVWIITNPHNNGTGKFWGGSSVPDEKRDNPAQEQRWIKFEYGAGGHLGGNSSNSDEPRLQRFEGPKVSKRSIANGYRRASSWWLSEPAVCRVHDGLPIPVDRLKALGNAVVPQIPEIIGRAIMEVERERP